MTKTATSTTAAPSFQFFEGNVSISSAVPQITVRKGGLVVLTKAAADMLNDGDTVTHIQLAYDPSTQIVGIRSCDLGTAGAYTLRHHKSNPSRLIGGKRFFKHYSLDITAAKTYTAEDFGDGIIGFRLVTDAEAVEPEAKPAPAKPAPAKATATKKPATRRKAKGAA